jgi:hypothetical protein
MVGHERTSSASALATSSSEPGTIGNSGSVFSHLGVSQTELPKRHLDAGLGNFPGSREVQGHMNSFIYGGYGYATAGAKIANGLDPAQGVQHHHPAFYYGHPPLGLGYHPGMVLVGTGVPNQPMNGCESGYLIGYNSALAMAPAGMPMLYAPYQYSMMGVAPGVAPSSAATYPDTLATPEYSSGHHESETGDQAQLDPGDDDLIVITSTSDSN